MYICTCTVQLTRNLNASVEYERFYSRVSMCETRALEHSYSSFTRRSDPSHSSTRALVLELEHSSARLDSTRTSQLDIPIRAIEHRTRRYYNYIHARTGTYKLHARTHMARMSVTDTRYVHGLCTVPLLGASNKAL